MKVESFEDIVCWQRSKILSLRIYTLLHPNSDHGFKNQLQRAAVSVMNNIAEGFERRSNKEFRQYLFIAKGSCGEVRSMLHLACELKYVSEKEFQELHDDAIEISKMLSGFIKTL